MEAGLVVKPVGVWVLVAGYGSQGDDAREAITNFPQNPEGVSQMGSESTSIPKNTECVKMLHNLLSLRFLWLFLEGLEPKNETEFSRQGDFCGNGFHFAQRRVNLGRSSLVGYPGTNEYSMRVVLALPSP